MEPYFTTVGVPFKITFPHNFLPLERVKNWVASRLAFLARKKSSIFCKRLFLLLRKNRDKKEGVGRGRKKQGSLSRDVGGKSLSEGTRPTVTF